MAHATNIPGRKYRKGSDVFSLVLRSPKNSPQTRASVEFWQLRADFLPLPLFFFRHRAVTLPDLRSRRLALFPAGVIERRSQNLCPTATKIMQVNSPMTLTRTQKAS